MSWRHKSSDDLVKVHRDLCWEAVNARRAGYTVIARKAEKEKKAVRDEIKRRSK